MKEEKSENPETAVPLPRATCFEELSSLSSWDPGKALGRPGSRIVNGLGFTVP